MRSFLTGCAALLLAGCGMPAAAGRQADVQSTDVAAICAPGWAGAHRMPLSEWREVAPRVFAAHGVSFAAHRAYELDHRVPLELGGGNDAVNLWPEPLAEARVKDLEENRLHAEVCAGRMDIRAAQQAMRLWTPPAEGGHG